MFRHSLESSQSEIGELFDERRDGFGSIRVGGVPRFRRSEVCSSDHFEKRKLGRIVSKLSLVDRLEILEERDDDGDHGEDGEDDHHGSAGLSRQDSGVSIVSSVDTDHETQVRHDHETHNNVVELRSWL